MPDVMNATPDCHEARTFLKGEFNIQDDNVITLFDQDYETIVSRYNRLTKEIAMSKTKTLFIHVFAGHGHMRDGKQTLLINGHDQWIKSE